MRSLRSLGGDPCTGRAPPLIPAPEEGRGTAYPRPSRYLTLRATAVVALALGALASRRAAAVAAASGAAGTAVRIAAAAGAQADADGQADAQAGRDALFEPLQRWVQVSHTINLPRRCR